MATLTVRNIDNDHLAGLAAQAKANNRTLAAEVRELIAEAIRKNRAKQSVDDFLDFTRKHPLILPDGKTSLDLLREERDSW